MMTDLKRILRLQNALRVLSYLISEGMTAGEKIYARFQALY
jgi:hypothetical protein